MNVRLEEWLDQMRQAREPGTLVRVVVVRSGRTDGWTFDVTDHLTYRREQAALAQVVGPAGALSIPYEVTESITAALRSHKSFTMLGLKGIAEGQESSKQIITMLKIGRAS